MNESEKLKVIMKKRMFRWSLVSAGAIALYWLVFYLVKGNVPVVKIPENYPIAYFSGILNGISRWWDIFIGPLWSIPLAYFSTFGMRKLSGYDKTYLVLGPMFSLVFGFLFSLVFGLVYGLLVGFLFGLCFVLVSVFVFAFWADIRQVSKYVIRWLRAEEN